MQIAKAHAYGNDFLFVPMEQVEGARLDQLSRRLCERLTLHLSERLGADKVASHHGSMSREKRLEAEQRLKAGALSALVATASLELGIDIGAVDLVIQIGTTRSIATLLQRVGRAGHRLEAIPKGRLFPLSRDELVECAALLRGVYPPDALSERLARRAEGCRLRKRHSRHERDHQQSEYQPRCPHSKQLPPSRLRG